jgi:hypothetical protein
MSGTFLDEKKRAHHVPTGNAFAIQAVDMATSREHLAPLAMVVAAAAVGALTVRLSRSNRRPTRSRQNTQHDTQRDALVSYLRDHLSGADSAIQVVEHLCRAEVSAEDRHLFERLAREFRDDRAVVRELVEQLGASPHSLKRAIGAASGNVLASMSGGRPGDLSLWRTLEALAIGVQGKRCLWTALRNIHVAPWALTPGHFAHLEAKAINQFEAIEERRRALAAPTFVTSAIASEERRLDLELDDSFPASDPPSHSSPLAQAGRF